MCHGHQTWLDDLGIRYVLQSERMGHEVEGMRGIYSHITPGMRAELTAGLQQLWEESLRQRSGLSPTSAIRTLDQLLESQRERTGTAAIGKAGSLTARKVRPRSLTPEHSDWEATS
jgi:hypothetical protein